MDAEDFGNADLKGLREIQLPTPVSYAPETIGWWIVAGILLALIALAGFLWMRHRRRGAYRRRALARLAAVKADVLAGRAAALQAVPQVVKRTALDAWPRSTVAVLSGDAWLAFLDTSYGGTGFTAGAGRVLPELAYGASSLSDAQAHDLLAIVTTWVRTHRA